MSLCLFPCLQTKGKYQPPTFRMAWGPRGLFCTTICNVHRIVPLDSLWTRGMHCRRASWWFLETMFLFNGFNHLQEPEHRPVILSCSWFPRLSACLAWTPWKFLEWSEPSIQTQRGTQCCRPSLYSNSLFRAIIMASELMSLPKEALSDQPN